MTRKAKAVEQSKHQGLYITPATLGIILTCLGILAGLWKIGSAIATKADVESIKAAISPTLLDHSTRIRDLELQMARFFGASQVGVPRPAPSAEFQERIRMPGLVLAQYSAPLPPPMASTPAAPKIPASYRRVVVP